MTRWQQVLWCCAEPRDTYAAPLKSSEIAARLKMGRTLVSKMLGQLRTKGYVGAWRGCVATDAGRDYIRSLEQNQRAIGAWVDL